MSVCSILKEDDRIFGSRGSLAVKAVGCRPAFRRFKSGPRLQKSFIRGEDVVWHVKNYDYFQ